MAPAFALTMATSAQAMPVPKLDVPQGLVTHVARHVASDFDGFAASAFVEPLSDKPAALSAGLLADAQAFACVITEG
jgi:hypothetical protein